MLAPIFDKNRFVFRMSDTNTVYIDTINLEKLNKFINDLEMLEKIIRVERIIK